VDGSSLNAERRKVPKCLRLRKEIYLAAVCRPGNAGGGGIEEYLGQAWSTLVAMGNFVQSWRPASFVPPFEKSPAHEWHNCRMDKWPNLVYGSTCCFETFSRSASAI
jgi:hypothetical protein